MVVAYATDPVLLKMRVALFCVPAASTLLPYCPDESMVPLPSRVNRRSIETDGVCVAWKMLAFDPVYWRVPPAKTRLAALFATSPAPMLLAVPMLAS